MSMLKDAEQNRQTIGKILRYIRRYKFTVIFHIIF